MSRRTLALVAVVAVIVVAALWRSAPSTVSTVSLQREDVVRTLALVGRVRPHARARLGATIAGSVRDVTIREGDRVGRGDVLVQLDDREARALVAQARASLAEIEAAARSTLEQAEVEYEQARRELERLRALLADGVGTIQRLEQAEQRAADAVSQLEAARASADSEAEGGPSASVVRARAALDAALARLALTRIVAPTDGVILTRQIEPGDAVQPGATLLQIALDGPTELVVFPSEENLGGLRVGAPAVASADAYPDEIFRARVSLIAPSVDPAQGTVEVRLAVDEPPDYLLPEMTVSVNIQAGKRPNAVVLPEEAVRGLGTNSPWVAVVRDGRVARQEVEVGLRAERLVEILSGVDPTDEIVSGDAPDLGERVRVDSDPVGG